MFALDFFVCIYTWKREQPSLIHVRMWIMADPIKIFRNLVDINHFASVDVYTCKTFPNCKTEDVYTRFAAYSRNSYSNFGRHVIFSESSGSCLRDPGQKALQTMIEPTLFVDFCLIPLSNTCSFVRPARNVNREIFLHRQEGFCVGKFGRVVDQVVLENRPLRKHFRWSRLRY